jgi:hypothetical protein
MTTPSSLVALAAAWTAGGLAFGLVYFAALRRTVDIYGVGQGRLVPAALTVGRFVAAIVFLGFSVRFGALPLLAAFLGFLMARLAALRTSRRMA